MKMKKLLVVLLALTVLALAVTVNAGSTAVFTAETVAVDANGGTTDVDVAITLDDNPGIACMNFQVTYDAALTLKSITRGDALSTLTYTAPGNLSANPVNISMDSLTNDTSTGTIVTLTFEVPTAAHGQYPISLSYTSGNIINQDFDDVDVSMTAGSITVHTWNDGEVTTPASCTTPGVKTYTCSGCGATKTEEILATGHTLTHHDAVPATCTTAGAIEYWSCSSCNKNFSDAAGATEVTNLEVPAAGHTLTHTEAVPATCTAAGNTEYWYCTVCEKYFSDAEGATETTLAATVIPAAGHTLTHTDAAPATCTEAGNTEYWYCTVCEKYFSDAEGTTETTLAATVIPSAGHTLTHTEAAPATCTEAGNTEYWYCTVCEKYFSDAEATTEITQAATVVPAAGHALVYAVEGGVLTETCANCDHTATATISAARTRYTGEAVTPATVEYGAGWLGGDLEIAYANNTAAGTATASITAGGVTATVEFKIYVPGDVDGNGTVNMRDVLTLRQFMAGGYGVTVATEDGDLDHNGTVNMRDVLMLRQYMAGGYGIELT